MLQFTFGALHVTDAFKFAQRRVELEGVFTFAAESQRLDGQGVDRRSQRTRQRALVCDKWASSKV